MNKEIVELLNQFKDWVLNYDGQINQKTYQEVGDGILAHLKSQPELQPIHHPLPSNMSEKHRTAMQAQRNATIRMLERELGGKL